MAATTVTDRKTSDIRTIAQQHLTEIEQDLEQQEKDEVNAAHMLEAFAKKPRQARRKLVTKNSKGKSIGDQSTRRSTSPPSNSDPATEKGPKMRTADEVLNRLLWDSELDIKQYRIGYLERFQGLLEIPAADWVEIVQGDDTTGEEWIPMHRIKYFKCVHPETGVEEVVWDRATRKDSIFGNGSPDESHSKT